MTGVQTCALPIYYDIKKVKYKKVHKGIKTIEATKNEIDLFYKEGHISNDEIDFYPNEYAILKSPESSSAICKYNVKSRRLEPLIEYKRSIWGIYPLNVEQRCAMDLLLRDDINLVTLVGPAGTGKTLLALACAMKKVFDDALYNKILISRPIIPLGKDKIGRAHV